MSCSTSSNQRKSKVTTINLQSFPYFVPELEIWTDMGTCFAATIWAGVSLSCAILVCSCSVSCCPTCQALSLAQERWTRGYWLSEVGGSRPFKGEVLSEEQREAKTFSCFGNPDAPRGCKATAGCLLFVVVIHKWWTVMLSWCARLEWI